MPQRREILTTPRRWPIRVATTVIAAAIVTLVLAAAAGGAWLMLRSVVHNAIDTADRNRAVDVANSLSTRGPQRAVDLVAEQSSGVDLVRIIAPDGRLLAAQVTRGLQDLGPLPIPAAGEMVQHEVTTPNGSELRVTSVGVNVGGLTFAVDVGTDTDRYDALLGAGAILFLSFVPVAGLATAVFVHYAMGKVLRPVESIRSRVAEISVSGRGERVPVPEAEDEIARLARTMNAMLARLDAARTAQVAFVGDASHELRSPLSTLSTMLELASTSRTPVDVETVDELLMPEVLRMRSMVEDLLLLAKNDEQGMPLRREDVDLDDIVLSEASRLRGLGGTEVSVSVEPARIVGDPDALVRVVRNLVDNARRHAHREVNLRLTVDRTSPAQPLAVGRTSPAQPLAVGRTSPAQPLAVITIDDDGEGITPEKRATVFDRFARLDTDRGRSNGGSGLGLAIVAEITRTHGGTVQVQDAPGGGARFVVELPVDPSDHYGELEHFGEL